MFFLEDSSFDDLYDIRGIIYDTGAIIYILSIQYMEEVLHRSLGLLYPGN